MYILKGEHKKGLSASKLRSRQNLLVFAIDTFTISKLLHTLHLTNLSKSMYQFYIKTHTHTQKHTRRRIGWIWCKTIEKETWEQFFTFDHNNCYMSLR